MPLTPVPIFKLVEGNHPNNILLHAIRSADTAANGALDIGHIVEDGFYRIVQYNQDSTPYDAIIATVDKPSLPVTMYSGPNVLPRVWKLTRQFGIKDGFTIVPVTDPITDPPGLGVTVKDKNEVAVVEKASCYPIWTVRCDERIDYRNPDGSITTIYLFRILVVNTNLCWKTNTSEQVVIETAKGQPPAPNQLYRLVFTRPAVVLTVQSVDNVVTTAIDENIVRKFYSGYTAEDKVYSDLQLTTDARDQGWRTGSGLWSWLEISILFSAPSVGTVVTPDQIKKDSSGNLCTWVSHYIPLTSTYTEQTGPVFDATHPLWKNLAPGNVISVLVVAQFGGWKGDVRNGTLAITEFLDEIIPL